MNTVSLKKKIWYAVIVVVVFSSCYKQDAADKGMKMYDAAGVTRPRLRRLPRIPVPLSRCIYSYQDITEALGANTVLVHKAVLASGAVIEPGEDVAYITYEATPSSQSNSVFDSKLSVEWRWPGGNWQLSTANVWSLGCVYEQAGQPPFTNIIKGGDILLVNTCFYWNTGEHTGERVDYLIAE